MDSEKPAKKKAKYLPIRLVGEFEQHITRLADLWGCTKTAAARMAAKRVHDEEFPSAARSPKPS